VTDRQTPHNSKDRAMQSVARVKYIGQSGPVSIRCKNNINLFQGYRTTRRPKICRFSLAQL